MTGFTLIELMVSLAIGVTLVLLAVPSYRGFIATQRIKNAAYDLNYTLVFARSEAIKRAGNVVITPSSTCWQSGWTVTVGGTTLSQQAAYPDLQIAASASPAASITFNSEGRLTSASTPFQISSLTLASAKSRCVNLDLSGLPSSKVNACTLATVSCP